RLLLCGNNGTGKSKVLALTLPFLLDGDLSARNPRLDLLNRQRFIAPSQQRASPAPSAVDALAA
ncbi:hypothetical protein, partial [Streptomyces sp. NPDC002346]